MIVARSLLSRDLLWQLSISLFFPSFLRLLSHFHLPNYTRSLWLISGLLILLHSSSLRSADQIHVNSMACDCVCVCACCCCEPALPSNFQRIYLLIKLISQPFLSSCSTICTMYYTFISISALVETMRRETVCTHKIRNGIDESRERERKRKHTQKRNTTQYKYMGI